jgi:predicted hydrocarbon binding protein
MPAMTGRQQEFALPAEALAALRENLAAGVGAEVAADALRAAGYAAGDAFFEVLLEASDDPLESPAEQFWTRLGRLFSSRGWGQLTYSEAHPGVGALTATNWAEHGEPGTSDQPCCHVTTGLLANLLGRIAGAEVAVLEAECRGRGDGCCRFLFGGPDAVYAVYEGLSAGEAAEDALARIR